MIKTFFHYSPNIKEIEKSGCIKDISFAKTNTYDVLLEVCPELILDQENIKKFNKYKKDNKPTIKRYEREQKDGSYESKYRGLKLKYNQNNLCLV